MKKLSRRFFAILLSIVLIMAMLPDTLSINVIAQTPILQKQADSPTDNSGLKPFTSTEQLIADMEAELAEKSAEEPVDENAIKEEKALAFLVEKNSAYTLDEVKSKLGIQIFGERDKEEITVSEYNLNKDEMESVTKLVLEDYNAVTLVEVNFTVNKAGIADTMSVKMDPGFQAGLDDLDTMKGVGEISDLTTDDNESTAKKDTITIQKVREREMVVEVAESSGEPEVSEEPMVSGEPEVSEQPHTVHSYGEPEFIWESTAEGGYICAASFSCTECVYINKMDCTVVVSEAEDMSYIYTATCQFEGQEYTNTLNEAQLLYKDWAAMCTFISENTEYYGIPTEYWVSKNTEATPMGAMKILAGYDADAPIPPVNMDYIIAMLTKAFSAYVYYYGEGLLAVRNQALATVDENMTDLQKCLVLHDYLATHAQFDMGSLLALKNGGQGTDPIEMTPFGTLLGKVLTGKDGAICLGYAATYVYLIQSAFPEVYRNTDGTLKSYEEVMDSGDDMIDMVRIRYNCDPADVSVAGPESGFEGNFREPHFFNAVKLDGQWYYVDVCYDDIKPETMTQYRVETDGNLTHMYFLTSHQTVEDWYEGYYEYIDSLHDTDSPEPCDSVQYEDAWFSNINSPIYYDDTYWYYVEPQFSYKQMIDMMDQISPEQMDEFMGQMNNADYADQMKVRLRSNMDDLSDSDTTVLIDYGYGNVTNLKTGETVANEVLLADCDVDVENNKIYPELNHSLGIYNNTIYFNVNNKIYMLDLDDTSITQLKEYNNVYAKSNGVVFTANSFYSVDAESDDIDFHINNHPLASLCIKDDGVMYVSIATNYSNSKNSQYKEESVNYNMSYNRFAEDQPENVNTNVEFMWCANVKESINMSDVTAYLTGSPEYKSVTVDAWCDRQGYTENREVTHGFSAGTDKTVTSEPFGHHYALFEGEDSYVCATCHKAVKIADATEDMISTVHTCAEPEFVWTKQEEGGYTCKALFKCQEGGEVHKVTTTVTSETSSTDNNEVTVYTATCTFGGIEYTDTKTVVILSTGEIYELDFIWTMTEEQSYECKAIFTPEEGEGIQEVACDITNLITDATCTVDGTNIYTAVCTFEGAQYSDNKSIVLPATGHEYGNPEFEWIANEEQGYDCKATFTCVHGDDSQEIACEVTSMKTDATCTAAGSIVYTAVCTFAEKEYTESKTIVLSATGHVYKEDFKWVENDEQGYDCKATFTCVDGDDTQEIVCEVTSKTTDATCSQAGTIVYTAVCTFEGKTWSDTFTVNLPAIGHLYGEPVLNWTENSNHSFTCSATFACNECNDVQNIACKVTSKTTAATCTAGGSIVYTASCQFGDKTYTDTKKVVIPARGHEFIYRYNANATRTITCKHCDYYKVEVITPSQPTNLKATSYSYNSIKFSWSKVQGATKYQVYRKTSTGWQKLAVVTGTSYTNTGLNCGSSYNYTVSALNSAGYSSYSTKGVTAKPVMTTPTLKAVSSGYNSAKISWSKVTGANGYYVYRMSGTKWVKIKTITSGNTVSYTNSGLTSGKNYKYTIVAYRKVNGKVVRSSYNKTGVTVKSIPTTPTIKALSYGKKAVKISWKKVSGASGYYVYRKSGSKWVKIKTITKGSTTSYVNGGLKKGSTYRYTVVAYRTVSGKKIRSLYNKNGVSAKAK